MSKTYTLPQTPTSIEHAVLLAKQTIGQTLQEINILDTFGTTKGNNTRNKGLAGNIYQENVFGQKPNSDKTADLNHLGLEVKLIPVKRNSKGELVAKERIVGNIINYMNESLTGVFTDSSYYIKNSKTLYVLYEVTDTMNVLNNKIIGVILHDITQSVHYSTIVEDYKIISNKIVAGLAHTLSEKDTKFLAACTKGSGHGKDLRPQPNNTILAKQRAFSLKPSYVNEIIKSINS